MQRIASNAPRSLGLEWNRRRTPDEAEEVAGGAIAGRPWLRLLLALLLLFLFAALAAWIQRRTIARDFIDRKLSRRNVPARYEITQLSPWRQRLTNVVIGDPRRPDLVADWIEIRTALAPWRAEVLAVRVGRVRLRGQVMDGRVSLGTIDRLLPPHSGKPFALPALIVDMGDAQLALATQAGAVRLTLAGKGMLRDGFRGTAFVAAPDLAGGTCAIREMRAQFAVRIRKGSPDLEGPVSAASARCGATGMAMPSAVIQANLSEGLDHWRGKVRAQASRVEQPQLRLDTLRGDISFAGDAQKTDGSVMLASGAFDVQGNRGRALTLAGRYAYGLTGAAFNGSAQARSAALAPALQQEIRRAGAGLEAGPAQPIATQLTRYALSAARSFDARADFGYAYTGGGGAFTLSHGAVRTASGGQLNFDGKARVPLGVASSSAQADGVLRLRGGGFPDARLRFSQGPDGIRGRGFVAPYAAGEARLAVHDLTFRLRGAQGEARAIANFTGSAPQGRVEGLILPLSAQWNAGSLRINPQCVDVRFQRAAIGGLVLGANRLPLCPYDGAMLQQAQGRTGGGIQVRAAQLHGALGGSAFRFAADRALVEWGRQRFAMSGAAIRLGGAGETRLDVQSLNGSLGATPSGMFNGLAGQLSSVPLLVSAGVGTWRFAGDAISLGGALQVRDAVTPVRFNPLATSNAALRVTGSEVRATATLNTLEGGTKVADVRIAHDLSAGDGFAHLDVRALRFTQAGFQPQNLTPLTFGVVADVEGAVSGHGEIGWTKDGVTSSGTFTTDGMDLAAAFGPVHGLATTLHFTDLLGMRTAPAQAAAIGEINPGVPVRDGRLRFQILDNRSVQVEGGRWPFAGGELVLEPTRLDFSESTERRLTFKVLGANAALFLKEMDFDNINATGTFDGTLPMVFDAQGGRIEGGNLKARAGGSIAYIGEVSRHDLGFWGNMAFQALRSLDYQSLSVDLSGPLAGDMVTQISFAGVRQGQGAQSNFLIRRLARLPLVFNIRITAPFQQLLGSVQSWYNPSLLIERNLPTLLEAERGGSGGQPAVQEPESDNVRQKEPK